jgi:hypothetical protein
VRGFALDGLDPAIAVKPDIHLPKLIDPAEQHAPPTSSIQAYFRWAEDALDLLALHSDANRIRAGLEGLATGE